MKNYNLFLDDERDFINNKKYLQNHHNSFGDLYFSEEWVIVRSYIDFKRVIEENGLPGRISFDHDLGMKLGAILPTGMDCCKWLIDYCLDNDLELTSKCRFHTANPNGEMNMVHLINNFKKFKYE